MEVAEVASLLLLQSAETFTLVPVLFKCVNYATYAISFLIFLECFLFLFPIFTTHCCSVIFFFISDVSVFIRVKGLKHCNLGVKFETMNGLLFPFLSCIQGRT